ncbi:hypothetical protein HYZ98_01860 [Candidatus Peregrinibacteria bacterium]|nr:hypothetical protein [Candidatus Peregrinibacteria bacterium]
MATNQKPYGTDVQLAGMFEWLLQGLCCQTRISEEEGRAALAMAANKFMEQRPSVEVYLGILRVYLVLWEAHAY